MLFYFSGFCTYSRFGNNFGGLNLGVSNERQFRALLFLDLGNLIHYNIFSSIHLPAYFTFFSWAASHSIYVPWFHYPYISWRTFRSVPSQAIRATKHIAEQVSLALCQRVVEPGLTVDLFLDLWEFFIPIARVTVAFCHATNSECVFSLLISPPSFCFSLFVDICLFD